MINRQQRDISEPAAIYILLQDSVDRIIQEIIYFGTFSEKVIRILFDPEFKLNSDEIKHGYKTRDKYGTVQVFEV